MFHAHIGGMDVLARGLVNAAGLIEGRQIQDFVDQRYAGWKTGLGAKMMKGEVSLSEMADHALDSNSNPELKSGRQEYLEYLVTNAS